MAEASQTMTDRGVRTGNEGGETVIAGAIALFAVVVLLVAFLLFRIALDTGDLPFKIAITAIPLSLLLVGFTLIVRGLRDRTGED